MELESTRYRIESEIGRGAFGVVYLAYDNVLQRTVALKVMSVPEGLKEEDREILLQRFYREARAAAGLSHVNIVTIHDISRSEDDRNFISMEYLEGRPLSELIAEGALPVPRAIEIATQVTGALVYAHSKDVIHRDIKPENIFVLDSDRIKLVDFGMARIQATSTLTKSGAVMGSPGYISPEVIEGKKADRRTDIFSLGVVLYEMLTGERPFGPQSAFESFAHVIYRIMSVDPTPPSRINPQVSGEIDNIVGKCLEKEPQDRFQTADELLDTLRRVTEGERYAERGESEQDAAVGGASVNQAPVAEEVETVIVDASGAGRTGRREPSATEVIDAPKDLEEQTGGGRRGRRIRVLLLASGSVAAVAGITVLILFLSGVLGGVPGVVECPNLVNLEIGEAEALLESKGLKLGNVEENYAFDIWKGKIARQFPGAGKELPRGSSVDVVVSLGQDVVMVPAVVGMSEPEAVQMLETFGFRARVETGRDDMEAGLVFDQKPPGGEVKARGEIVVIVVSEGPGGQRRP